MRRIGVGECIADSLAHQEFNQLDVFSDGPHSDVHKTNLTSELFDEAMISHSFHFGARICKQNNKLSLSSKSDLADRPANLFTVPGSDGRSGQNHGSHCSMLTWTSAPDDEVTALGRCQLGSFCGITDGGSGQSTTLYCR